MSDWVYNLLNNCPYYQSLINETNSINTEYENILNDFITKLKEILVTYYIPKLTEFLNREIIFSENQCI